jgi:hypothetical protein
VIQISEEMVINVGQIGEIWWIWSSFKPGSILERLFVRYVVAGYIATMRVLDQCLQLAQLLTYFINLSIITVDCNGYTVCPKIGVQTTYYLIEDV